MTDTKLPRPRAIYFKEQFKWEYPELYEIIEGIFSVKANRTKYKSFWINYCGLYKDRKGATRMFTLAAALDFLMQQGYTIHFTVKGNGL